MNKVIYKIIGIVPVIAMAFVKFSVALPAHFLVYQPYVPDDLKEST